MLASDEAFKELFPLLVCGGLQRYILQEVVIFQARVHAFKKR